MSKQHVSKCCPLKSKYCGSSRTKKNVEGRNMILPAGNDHQTEFRGVNCFEGQTLRPQDAMGQNPGALVNIPKKYQAMSVSFMFFHFFLLAPHVRNDWDVHPVEIG